MFNKSAKRIDFSKSYRTTQEIMSAADNVAEHIGLNRSDLVVRHGNEVMLSSLENEKDIINHIISKIEEYKEKGYKTVAIISKTFELSKTINKGLMEEGYDLPELSINDNINEEKFSICTISNQLVKGLEFDAVIITNASEMVYSSYSNLDMKLLYVAITRALHELDIIYNKDITKPLKKMLKKI